MDETVRKRQDEIGEANEGEANRTVSRAPRPGQFVKGGPGGPGRGGKATSITGHLRRTLMKRTRIQGPDGVTRHISYAEGIAIGLIYKALGGNIEAAKVILERIDGPAPKDHANEPMTIQIAYVDQRPAISDPSQITLPRKGDLTTMALALRDGASLLPQTEPDGRDD